MPRAWPAPNTCTGSSTSCERTTVRCAYRSVWSKPSLPRVTVSPGGAGNAIRHFKHAYPRPRDRRLTRKTRAAVGKPPARAENCPAVRSADKFGECLADVCLPQSTTAVARRKKLAQDRSCLRWLSQPG